MNRPDSDNINTMSTISSIKLLDRAYAWYRAHQWISWAQSGVRVETLWLKLKTTVILQNICGEILLLE